MRFQYIAFTAEGSQVKGQVRAATADEAIALLGTSDLVVAEVRPDRPLLQLVGAGGFLDLSRADGFVALAYMLGVGAKDVSIFSRQLANLIESGVSIGDALLLLQREAPSAMFRDILQEVHQSVMAGKPFSAACGEHSRSFPGLYVRLVAVGEDMGNLAPVLRKVADFLDRRAGLRDRLFRAGSYPLLLVVMAVLLGTNFVTQVLPNFIPLFEEWGAELPAATRALVALTAWWSEFGLWCGLALCGFLAALAVGLSVKPGRFALSALLTRLPLVGPVFIKSNIAGASSTLTMLLAAGMPLTNAMWVVLESTGNRFFRSHLERIVDGLLQGFQLSVLFAADPLFPKLVPQLLAAGETSGDLVLYLESLTAYYDQEARRSVDTMIAAVEPLLILSVGAIVAMLAAAIVAPLYGVLKSIR